MASFDFLEQVQRGVDYIEANLDSDIRPFFFQKEARRKTFDSLLDAQNSLHIQVCVLRL